MVSPVSLIPIPNLTVLTSRHTVGAEATDCTSLSVKSVQSVLNFFSLGKAFVKSKKMMLRLAFPVRSGNLNSDAIGIADEDAFTGDLCFETGVLQSF